MLSFLVVNKMLKSCSRCGRVHDFNKQCFINKQIRGCSTADKFRKTYRWHKKSEEIRKRDNYLCQVCLADIYNTDNIYNYNKLEVHHITSLEEDINRCLDNDNLITLCCYHHKLADKKLIPKFILEKLIQPNRDLLKIKAEVNNQVTPLASYDD